MYLPSAPEDTEQTLFLESGRLRLYLVSSVSTVILSIGMALFVLVNPLFIPYTLFASLTIFYLTISYLIGFLGHDFDHEVHIKLVNKYFLKSARQEVDIFLPVCGEPIEVLTNTWENVLNLKNIHGPQVNVHVLDDGQSLVVKQLASNFDFNYIARGTTEMKKAGNLRYAFTRTSAEFIVIFDADFCPRSNFLIQTLPYMYQEPMVAIVQTPQFFSHHYLQNYIQKGASAIQELFYRLIQVNRDTFEGSICVGTNALYRRESLVPFGGTAAIGYSEDVRTGFRCQAAGDRLVYVPLNLAKGICPDTWGSFFTQQYRWAMGSIDLMCSREFWVAPISFMQRICYLTGMLYYTVTGLSSVFAFVPSIFLLIAHPTMMLWYNLLWAVPSLLLTNLYMRFWQKTPFTWAAIECRQVSYYAHLFAIWDTVFASPEPWIPTGTTASSARYKLFNKVLFFHTALVLGALFFLVGFRISQGYDWWNFAPVLALSYYHLASLARPMMDQ